MKKTNHPHAFYTRVMLAGLLLTFGLMGIFVIAVIAHFTILPGAMKRGAAGDRIAAAVFTIVWPVSISLGIPLTLLGLWGRAAARRGVGLMDDLRLTSFRAAKRVFSARSAADLATIGGIIGGLFAAWYRSTSGKGTVSSLPWWMWLAFLLVLAFVRAPRSKG